MNQTSEKTRAFSTNQLTALREEFAAALTEAGGVWWRIQRANESFGWRIRRAEARARIGLGKPRFV